MVGLISSESDGDGNRAGPDSERQSQRIKRIPENILQVDLFVDVGLTVVVFLALEHGPSVGNDNEAAADLHHRNGNPEEIQNVRTDQKRSDQQYEAVHGHAAGEDSAGGGRVVLRQGEKNGTPTDRIHDREKCAEDEKDAFGDFQQRGSSGAESVAKATLHRTPLRPSLEW